MLAVVHFRPIRDVGGGLATEQAAALEDFDLVPAPAQFDRRTQAGQPGADDGYMACSHDFTITLNLVLPESDTRLVRGKAGSRSICPRIVR